MQKVLLVGNAPLPSENTSSRPAAGLRTWQFLQALLAAGLEVKLICIAMPECYEQEPTYQTEQISGRYSKVVISKQDVDLVKRVQHEHDAFKADLIVSVNTFPSYIVAQLDSELPFWADLNGWIMAEAQAHAFKTDTNDYLPHYLEMENTILKEADKFSVVSDAQKFTVLGELGAMGRLNKESFAYNFVQQVANGTEWFEGEREAADFPELFKNVPEDAFVALWLGGYNTWVDEEALFKGVVEAMRQCEKLYFVSTGGGIKGLDNKTFTKFKYMIDNSEFSERFVFLGWVETEQIPYIYKRAHAGLNVDRACVETLTGARNRINEMMKFGLPVVTTLGSEISYEVMINSCGLGVQSGAVGEAIVRMYEGWRSEAGDFILYGQKGQQYIQEKCNYRATVRPLIEWIANLGVAPDRGVRLSSGIYARVRGGMRYLREKGVKKFMQKVRQKL